MVFGVGIIIAVYVPIFSLQGLEGRMFGPMAFTVCTAIFGSLLLALTFVPAAGSFLLTDVREIPAALVRNAESCVRVTLDWSLGHRVVVTGAVVVLLVVALGSVPFLGTEFMPRLDEGSLLIETRRPPSTSLAQGMAISKDVERTLMRFPEVRAWSPSSAGRRCRPRRWGSMPEMCT